MLVQTTTSFIKKWLPLTALSLSLATGLSSCISTPEPPFKVDQRFNSFGQGERIKFIVLHYTAENDFRSLTILTTDEVSAHYLIPSSQTDKIYQLVDDEKRAWHAGKGSFAGRTMLNDTSLGIEIVNPGIKLEYQRQNSKTHSEVLNNNGYHPAAHFQEYTELQILKVAHLVSYLSKKYDIDPTHIIGHSDMAPSRKIDPGAKFPWKRLYNEYDIGAWYNEKDKLHFMSQADFDNQTVVDIKQAFRNYGYPMNSTKDWDRDSQNVVYAFQLHFRPNLANGIVDLETYAILKALIKKYGSNKYG